MTKHIDPISRSVKTIASLLTAAKIKIATAESCTGGWIAQSATQLAGSSDWFDCGFVTYSNESKQHMLGVSAKTLQCFGAVSAEVVKEMVCGAIRQSQAKIAVAVSGIAGPAGGSRQKPVGTVWIAWAMEGTEPIARVFQFQGDRSDIRRQAVVSALEGIETLLKKT